MIPSTWCIPLCAGNDKGCNPLSGPSCRGYNPKDMSEDTALKAIDLYFSLLKEGKAYNPYRAPSIAFYGGEPLLNFELIKTCINYIMKTYGDDFNPYFVMTTNSTLLSEEIVSFLNEHNCEIVLSIDGPREEHDRNRVFPGGKGSFDIVMENTKFLAGSNLKTYLNLMNLVISVLNRHTGKYKDPYIPFTGSGIPGLKLFVDAFGSLRICERTFGDVSVIGDVESGLDYEKILSILQSLRSETAACESCVAKNMCSVCYVTFASGPAITRDPAVCEDVQMRLEGRLSHLWSIAEISEDAVIELAEEYYTLFEDIGKELV